MEGAETDEREGISLQEKDVTDRTSCAPRRIWFKLYGEEIVELKQVMMDRDVEGARAFFHRVVVPRVREAAERRNIAMEEQDDALPG